MEKEKTEKGNKTPYIREKYLVVFNDLFYEILKDEKYYDEALQLLHSAKKHKLLKGNNFECSAAAIMYIIARKYNMPITLADITRVTQKTNRHMIFNCYSKLIKSLNIYVPKPEPEIFIQRIAKELRLSDDVIEKAKELLIKANIEKMGKDPVGLACAAIYLSTTGISQKQLAEVANISEVTIRSRVKELIKYVSK